MDSIGDEDYCDDPYSCFDKGDQQILNRSKKTKPADIPKKKVFVKKKIPLATSKTSTTTTTTTTSTTSKTTTTTTTSTIPTIMPVIKEEIVPENWDDDFSVFM